MDTMQITLNGKTAEIAENTTIETLLKKMELPRFFVVEHNKNIIYKENYPLICLQNGDELEVAAFCGGG